MPGIEVIGFILSFWPSVSDAAATCKAVRDGPARQDLIRKLNTYRIAFKGFVDSLIIGDEDLSLEDRVGLTDIAHGTVRAAWEDKGFQGRMEERLGPNTYPAIQNSAQRMLDLLRSLDTRFKRGEVDFSTGRNTRSRVRSFSRQTIPNPLGSLYLTELEDVKTCLEDLRHLAGVHSSSAIYVASHPSATQLRQPRRPAAPFKRPKRVATQFFDEFHDVLIDSFHCQCSAGHEANLRVYDDLFQILFAVDEEHQDHRLSEHRPSKFSLQSQPTFASDPGASRDDYSDGNLSPPFDSSDKEGDLTTATSEMGWSKSKLKLGSDDSGEHKTLAMLFSINPSGSNSLPIPDMCQFVKTMERTPPGSPDSPMALPSVGILGKGERSYTARIAKDDRDPMGACVTCMDDCLAMGQEWKLSRQKRIDLAYNLAASILQFYATKWIDQSWTWRNFSIRDDKRPQLFVTRKFFSAEVRSDDEEGGGPRAAGSIWRFVPEPLLVRLAFALIELAMGKRLFELRQLAGTTDVPGSEDEKDYETAMRLVEQGRIREQESNAYHQVVEACLRCQVLQDSGARALTTRNVDTFHDDLDKYIVDPLKVYFNQSWAVAAGE